MPGVSVMLPGGSTLRGGVGTSSGVAFGVPTLGGGVGASCRGSALVADGVSCSGTDMLNMSAICITYAVCLSPIVVSGIVGVGLSRECVRSNVKCVANNSDTIFGKGGGFWEDSVVLENRSFPVLGVYGVRHLECSIFGLTCQPSCLCGSHAPLLCGFS